MRPARIMLLPFGLGVLVWLIDAVADAFLFYRRPFLDLLILDVPPHDLFVRAAALAIFLVFGLICARLVCACERQRVRASVLNSMLASIRDVNQLLVSERHMPTLLDRACDILVRAPHCHSAWIALLDPRGAVCELYHAGSPDEREALRVCMRVDQPPCIEQALQTGELCVIPEIGAGCGDCPVAAMHGDRAAIVAPLEYLGEISGVIGVTVECDLADDPEQRALISELAWDIALGKALIETEHARDLALDVADAERARLRDITDTANALIVCLDPEGRITFFNRRCEELTGYRAAEVLGRDVVELFVPEESAEACRGIIKRMPSDRTLTTHENPWIGADGKRHIIAWRNSPVFEAGQFAGLVSVGEDVTELRATEQRFQTLVETMGDGLTVVDKDGIITYVNSAFAELMEAEPEDLIGRPAVELATEDHRELLRDQLKRRLAGEGTPAYRMEYRTATGRTVPVLVSGSPLRGPDGAVMGAFGVITSLVELERAQRELYRSERVTRALLNASDDLAALLERDGTVVAANEAFAQALGTTVADIEGDCVFDYLDPELSRARRTHLNRAFDTGLPQRFEDCNNGRMLDHQIYPVRGPAGAVERAAMYTRDVTRERQMEAALRESEERYRTLVQNASDIIYTVNSDGVLTSINGAVERITGYRPEELIGEDVSTLLGPQAHQFLMDLLDSGQPDERTPERYETAVTARDGREVIFEITTRLRRLEASDELEVGGIARDITERRRAEEALRRSEAHYRAVFENTGTAMCIIEEDGTISLANDEFARQSGWELDEIEGRMCFFDFLPDDERERMVGYHRARRTEGGSAPSRHEFTFRNRSGELRRVYVVVALVPGTSRSVASLMDITERERTARQLQRRTHELGERVKELRCMYNVARLAADPKLTVEELLSHAVQLLPPAWQFPEITSAVIELDGQRWTAGSPDGEPVASQRASLVIDGQCAGFVEVRYHQAMPEECHGPFLAEERDLLEALAENLSQTIERRRTERNLARLRAFRQSIIDQANIWLNGLDPAGNVVLWNRAAEEISGYSAEEVVGDDKIWELIYPDDDYRETVLSALDRVIHAGQTLENWSTTIRRKDGEERVISWHMRRLVDEQGTVTGSIALGRDITEHRALEEQLRQVQKMEAVGQLTAGIAHDFNNMLTAILGNAQLLQMLMEPDDRLHEYVTQITEAARRSAELTRRLLAFSRKQVMRPETVDLNEIVEDLKLMLRRMIPESIDMQMELSEERVPVTVDPSQMEQVVVNLCVNAGDAMPEGGTLTIRTRTEHFDRAQSRGIAGIAPGSWAVLEVEDTGVGMDEETRSRAFEPFYTTKEHGRGTGLGLSMVYGIVTQSGGTLDIDSELGKGTSICVYLPAAGADDRELEGSEATALHSYRGTETILVVEHDQTARALVLEVLRQNGYDVIQATSGREALEQCSMRGGEVAAVVADIAMPDISGPELLRRLRETCPHVRVLFLRDSDRNTLGDDALFENVQLLEKPFEPDQLARALRRALDGPW